MHQTRNEHHLGFLNRAPELLVRLAINTVLCIWIALASVLLFTPLAMVARQAHDFLRFGKWPEADLFFVFARADCVSPEPAYGNYERILEWLQRKDTCRVEHFDFMAFFGASGDWVGLNAIFNWYFDCHIVISATMLFFIMLIISDLARTAFEEETSRKDIAGCSGK